MENLKTPYFIEKYGVFLLIKLFRRFGTLEKFSFVNQNPTVCSMVFDLNVIVWKLFFMLAWGVGCRAVFFQKNAYLCNPVSD
ncbi:MAG: hypothetical protein LBN27_13285 [Prevotellaceae bacterium]|jgi:hypothetical protein|nr:hypothetical protein [Prevotellaceae bacterium]